MAKKKIFAMYRIEKKTEQVWESSDEIRDAYSIETQVKFLFDDGTIEAQPRLYQSVLFGDVRTAEVAFQNVILSWCINLIGSFLSCYFDDGPDIRYLGITSEAAKRSDLPWKYGDCDCRRFIKQQNWIE